MSPFSLSRPLNRRLFVISLCLAFVAFALCAGFRLTVAARRDTHGKLARASRSSANVNPSLAPCGAVVVTNSNDSGAGSLRDAITNACSGDSISFDMTPGHVTSPITLTSGELLITTSLTIQGPGAGTLTISGNNSSRVFEILPNQTATLSGITIANGMVNAINGTNKGGGILNAGNLTIDSCTISNNTSTGSGSINFAGGIFNATGTLNITNSTVSGNSAVGGCTTEGGGITNGGTLTITISTISNNSARDAGGCGGVNSGAGIFNQGTFTLTSSTVSGNAVSSNNSFDEAGGIFNSGNTTVTNSTLSGNSVSGSTGSFNGGGGIYSVANKVVIVNSTVSGNSVNGGGTQGGGVDSVGGASLIIASSTISGNSAANGTGGGIVVFNATPNIRNTIASGNSANVGPDVYGTFASQGNNLIGASDGSTGFTNGVNNDQVGSVASPIDALLAALGNNGGPTQTHALLAGSPALDAGNNCVANPAHCGDSNITQLTTDQRGPGYNRIVDGPDADTTATVDIGAYESQVLPTLADLPDT
ncbi:MAG TPA: choice-of-anchor Q domain-containing protein, partial [Pyrinomonadaceae bacterium]|nr:choice-of-anchor Q domain-containing protein [Pyrinomonadaceae bacterium]